MQSPCSPRAPSGNLLELWGVRHLTDLVEKREENHEPPDLGFREAPKCPKARVCSIGKPHLPGLNELIQLRRVLVIHTFKWKSK